MAVNNVAVFAPVVIYMAVAESFNEKAGPTTKVWQVFRKFKAEGSMLI
jgi:hypothetical protein